MELKLKYLLGDLNKATKLLIVPYGIETFYPHRINNYCILLIVPYGIETELPVRRWLGIRSFNRTLWN